MIEPLEIEIEVTLPDGTKTEKAYTISKFPAVAGREIIAQYPVSGLPKLGDYDTNEKIMFKILSYVAITLPNGNSLPLNSKALIDNHVPDWEALARLEMKMMEYNVSFFRDGRVSGFLDDLLEKLPDAISSMLTRLLELSQQKAQPPSES